MKNIIYLFLVLILFENCKKATIGQTPVDSISPGKVTNVRIINTQGGAIITYKLPIDKDIAYVKAEYSRDGIISTDHSSIYNNSLEIEGLSKKEALTVKLYSVDLSNNYSEPVEVVIHPLEAYVHTVFRSFDPVSDIGGINIKWENNLEKPVSITLLYSRDSVNYMENERYFSKEINGTHTFKGLGDTLTYFKAFVLDKWENSSDTLFFKLTPLYSQVLDRKKITQVKLPFDCTSEYPFGRWAYCLDGDNLDYGWISQYNNNPENDYNFPVATTFDLHDTAQVLSTKMWMRGLLEYGMGAFKDIEFWGSMELATNKPTDYWAFDDRGAWKEDWVYLGSFSTTKPSGPTGGISEGDKLWARENGFEFRLLNAPRVRYIRLLVNSTWSGAKAIELCEISFSGDGR